MQSLQCNHNLEPRAPERTHAFKKLEINTPRAFLPLVVCSPIHCRLVSMAIVIIQINKILPNLALDFMCADEDRFFGAVFIPGVTRMRLLLVPAVSSTCAR